MRNHLVMPVPAYVGRDPRKGSCDRMSVWRLHLLLVKGFGRMHAENRGILNIADPALTLPKGTLVELQPGVLASLGLAFHTPTNDLCGEYRDCGKRRGNRGQPPP